MLSPKMEQLLMIMEMEWTNEWKMKWINGMEWNGMEWNGME